MQQETLTKAQSKAKESMKPRESENAKRAKEGNSGMGIQPQSEGNTYPKYREAKSQKQSV